MLSDDNLFYGIPDPSRQGVDGVTMHDTDEIIRRVGIAKGYVPISEYRVDIGDGTKRQIDWVWVKKNLKTVVAAFEIEGSNVPSNSVDFDVRKLKFINKQHADAKCFIVTYSVRFDQEHLKWITLKNTGKKRFEVKAGSDNTIKWLPESELRSLINKKI